MPCISLTLSWKNSLRHCWLNLVRNTNDEPFFFTFFLLFFFSCFLWLPNWTPSLNTTYSFLINIWNQLILFIMTFNFLDHILRLIDKKWMELKITWYTLYLYSIYSAKLFKSTSVLSSLPFQLMHFLWTGQFLDWPFPNQWETCNFWLCFSYPA